MIKVKIADIIEQITPTFHFGQSNELEMDCAGLVIWYLKKNDIDCSWERWLIREVVTVSYLTRILRFIGFIRVKQEIDGKISILCTNGNRIGHVSILQDGLVYSMTKQGIEIIKEESIVTNKKYWYLPL